MGIFDWDFLEDDWDINDVGANPDIDRRNFNHQGEICPDCGSIIDDHDNCPLCDF